MSTHFTAFNTDVSAITLPRKFTFPFYYQPHDIAEVATKELQEYLHTQPGWDEMFGLTPETPDKTIGKMFGVMVVKNEENKIGYISAVSGKFLDKNIFEKFVPPVFDMLKVEGFFNSGMEEVSQYVIKINELENNPQYNAQLEKLKQLQNEMDADIAVTRERNVLAKRKRDEIRNDAKISVFGDEFTLLCTKLKQESENKRFFLKHLIQNWEEKIADFKATVAPVQEQIKKLKNERHAKSAGIQQRLFESYNFLNAKGETKDLLDIFAATALQKPPAAAGECAAPKLLHYAYKNDLTPIALAEFWWGKSPKSEIRKHMNYYPACQGKCKPILGHMLQGLVVDDNPMLQDPDNTVKIETVYEDDHILVINKPEGLLSVPGVNIKDCVHSRMKEKYPKAKGPIIVHRLDMQTSGIMLIAKNKNAHKQLQKQFIERTIKKQYIALLDGIIKGDKGTIDLPLRPDIEDRPRQLVCYEHGKNALTHWEVLERKNDQTRIRFFPVTGRTHQLRVHAAHQLGLNTPIVGDDLYGKFANRLHLHAEFIQFTHPVTQKLMKIDIAPEF
jgi:tRNA pseudouridine32 synthase/23S rRNA pseudouridine746 synthase